MKKLLASLLALIISFGMIICNQGDQLASSAAGADESWDRVEKAGALVAGLDDAFPPTGCKDTNTGKLIGFDIDLTKGACRHLGVKLKLQPIDWSNKQTELDNGNVDCLWNGFSKAPERVEAMALDIPHMNNNQIILVKTESIYKTPRDLGGRVVGAQGDPSTEATPNAVEDEEFKSSLKNVIQINDYTRAILEIQSGTIDTISTDEIVARSYLKNQLGSFRVLESDSTAISLASGDYVVGICKNDPALKDRIDETPRVMAKDDTMAIIFRK